jgi:hypothetical protein
MSREHLLCGDGYELHRRDQWNVTVGRFSGLLTDFVRSPGAEAIDRELRVVEDFSLEQRPPLLGTFSGTHLTPSTSVRTGPAPR